MNTFKVGDIIHWSISSGALDFHYEILEILPDEVVVRYMENVHFNNTPWTGSWPKEDLASMSVVKPKSTKPRVCLNPV